MSCYNTDLYIPPLRNTHHEPRIFHRNPDRRAAVPGWSQPPFLEPVPEDREGYQARPFPSRRLTRLILRVVRADQNAVRLALCADGVRVRIEPDTRPRAEGNTVPGGGAGDLEDLGESADRVGSGVSDQRGEGGLWVMVSMGQGMPPGKTRGPLEGGRPA